MLDINELFLGDSAHLTFIEPFPARLLEVIGEEEVNHHTIIRKPVQEVPLGVFESLSENDILFVDSTHVIKIGSDVGQLLFNILPVLKPGVLVHFHDFFWPFEYPQEWLYQGIAWNEQYILRAFLQYNKAFEIIFFNQFLGYRHGASMKRNLPACVSNFGVGLWLRVSA
jgi:hypothetical protein